MEGARLKGVAYAPERRAIRLHVENPSIRVTVKPLDRTVNPVFELVGAPPKLAAVYLGPQKLPSDHYAWDGRTLWVRADIEKPTEIRVEFDEPAATRSVF